MITLKELMGSGYSEEAARYLLKGDYAAAHFQQVLDNGNPLEIQALAAKSSVKRKMEGAVDEITKDIWAKAQSMNAKKSRP